MSLDDYVQHQLNNIQQLVAHPRSAKFKDLAQEWCQRILSFSSQIQVSLLYFLRLELQRGTLDRNFTRERLARSLESLIADLQPNKDQKQSLAASDISVESNDHLKELLDAIDEDELVCYSPAVKNCESYEHYC